MLPRLGSEAAGGVGRGGDSASSSRPIFARSAGRGSAGGELGQHAFPRGLVAAAVEGGHDRALFVEERDERLVGRAESPGELTIWILELRPVPALLLQERGSGLRRVGDVQADEGVLRVGVNEVCVGDRLALAGASPGRPDVDEERPAAILGDVERLAVERCPGDFGHFAGRLRRGSGGRRCSGLRLSRPGPARLGLGAAAADEEKRRDCGESELGSHCGQGSHGGQGTPSILRPCPATGNSFSSRSS